MMRTLKPARRSGRGLANTSGELLRVLLEVLAADDVEPAPFIRRDPSALDPAPLDDLELTFVIYRYKFRVDDHDRMKEIYGGGSRLNSGERVVEAIDALAAAADRHAVGSASRRGRW